MVRWVPARWSVRACWTDGAWVHCALPRPPLCCSASPLCTGFRLLMFPLILWLRVTRRVLLSTISPQIQVVRYVAGYLSVHRDSLTGRSVVSSVSLLKDQLTVPLFMMLAVFSGLTNIHTAIPTMNEPMIKP